MERPNTVTGLTAHLIRSRWSALSPRGRFAALAVAGLLTLGGLSAARAAMGGCAHSCPASHAAAD